MVILLFDSLPIPISVHKSLDDVIEKWEAYRLVINAPALWNVFPSQSLKELPAQEVFVLELQQEEDAMTPMSVPLVFSAVIQFVLLNLLLEPHAPFTPKTLALEPTLAALKEPVFLFFPRLWVLPVFQRILQIPFQTRETNVFLELIALQSRGNAEDPTLSAPVTLTTAPAKLGLLADVLTVELTNVSLREVTSK